MALLEHIKRANIQTKYDSDEAFVIKPSTIDCAGMACFASRKLVPGDVVLRVQSPVASVVNANFRKEVCGWCYFYDFGSILKFKLTTSRGRGVAWFCSEACQVSWRNKMDDIEWQAILSFEDGLARLAKTDEPLVEGPTSESEIEVAWEDARREGEKILMLRKDRPHRIPKQATLPTVVDVDDARFLLSAILSFYRSPGSFQEILQMVPTLKPYSDSKSTLRQHIAIYHYLLSVIPIDSPIIEYITPAQIIATVTRDAGNSFGIWDQALAGQELFAYGMYPSASYFNHSCNPNVTKEREGREYVFKASAEIPVGAQKNKVKEYFDNLTTLNISVSLQATEYHLGLLKAKLAKYRAQLLEPTSKSSGGGTGFDVQKAGDARVCLIGFPSVGKSTLLSKMTNTVSEAAAYEFTTLTAIPGVIEYKGARIQLLDLPGIVEGASAGRGRGRQVVSTAKTSDLIVIMLDATKSTEQRRLLEIELDAVGIRLNRTKPDVVFKQKAAGGVTINATVKLTKIDEKAIKTILAGYKIHNCDVMIREDVSGPCLDVSVDNDTISNRLQSTN
ncbi:hypothetical protein FRC17_000032 [Serendipita sp. 399]|nr:hypothetical protein FRC17_000032 [Serendipita sp. 399]